MKEAAHRGFRSLAGVPDYDADEFAGKRARYALLIPVINEGSRIRHELERAKAAGIQRLVDIVICDGGSTDGSLAPDFLAGVGVSALLTKRGPGRQGAQLRMGIHWALARGYDAVLTIDGNDKDSIESVPLFLEKLEEGYDFIQGSRFLPSGAAIRTPRIRYLAVRLLHAPVISLTAHHWFTDTTNAYRAYSRRYLEDPRVQPLRDIFQSYELLAYLSVRATQIGLSACEVPVRRVYPAHGRTPTKISFFGGNWGLLKTLFRNLMGAYDP